MPEPTVDAAVRRRHLLPAAALLSHRSAAWLWDLLPPPDQHHVSVPRGRRPRRVGLVVHESSDLHLAMPGRLDALPVTGVGRTGIRRLGDLLAVDEMPHSDFERLACRWLTDLGIPGWRLHHRIVVPVRGPVEIDIA